LTTSPTLVHRCYRKQTVFIASNFLGPFAQYVGYLCRPGCPNSIVFYGILETGVYVIQGDLEYFISRHTRSQSGAVWHLQCGRLASTLTRSMAGGGGGACVATTGQARPDNRQQHASLFFGSWPVQCSQLAIQGGHDFRDFRLYLVHFTAAATANSTFGILFNTLKIRPLFTCYERSETELPHAHSPRFVSSLSASDWRGTAPSHP